MVSGATEASVGGENCPWRQSSLEASMHGRLRRADPGPHVLVSEIRLSRGPLGQYDVAASSVIGLTQSVMNESGGGVSMAMLGADPEELSRLHMTFQAGAGTLEGICRSIEEGLRASTWVGMDADIFVSDWSHVHTPCLSGIATELRYLASNLAHQAEQQQIASAVSPDGSFVSDIWAGEAIVAATLMVSRSGGGGWAAGGKSGGSVTARGDGTVGPVPYEGSMTAFARAHAQSSVTGSASWPHGLSETATVGLGVAAGAIAGGSIGSSNFGGRAGGSVEAAAETEGAVHEHLGLDGMDASASGRAFVGVQAQGSVSADLGGVTAGASGGVQFGAGVSGHADVRATLTDVRVSIGASAALGLGLSGGVNVNIDPEQVFQNVNTLAGNLVDNPDLQGMTLPKWL